MHRNLHMTQALQNAVQSSLVLRVKRKKLTVFVSAEPTDTVLEVKHKLHDMLGQVSRMPCATADGASDGSL